MRARMPSSMIQKMQKTVEILQVQFIDNVVEVPEVMQRHDPMIQKVEDAQKT